MLVQCRTIFLLVIRVAILSQPRRAGVGSTFLEKATWELANLTTFYHWLGVPVGNIPDIYGPLEDFWRIVGSKILEPLQSLQGFAEHRLEEGTLYCKKVSWETSTLFDKLSKRSDVKLFICQEQESLYTSLHQLKRLFNNFFATRGGHWLRKKGMFISKKIKRNSNKFQQFFFRDGYRMFHCQSLHVCFI